MFRFFRTKNVAFSSQKITDEVVGSKKVTHAVRESYEICLHPEDDLNENMQILKRYAQAIGYENSPILTRKEGDTIVLYFKASSLITGLNYNSSIYENIKWND